MEEKAKKIRELLSEQDLYDVKDVMGVNHKPHPYMIGTAHITYASKNCGGMIGEETLKNVRCAHPHCNLPYEEHTSDTVCFLQLKRNGTNAEANVILKALVTKIGDNFVDGFAFVESPEKYRINE